MLRFVFCGEKFYLCRVFILQFDRQAKAWRFSEFLLDFLKAIIIAIIYLALVIDC